MRRSRVGRCDALFVDVLCPPLLPALRPLAHTHAHHTRTPQVCDAARRCFGAAAVEADPSQRFRLHCAGAGEWIASHAHSERGRASIDVLIIDLEDGGSTPIVVAAAAASEQRSTAPDRTLRAPPPFVLDRSFFDDGALRALAPGGVLAINAIGTPEALSDAMLTMRNLLPPHFATELCAVPGDTSGLCRGGRGPLQVLMLVALGALAHTNLSAIRSACAGFPPLCHRPPRDPLRL